MVVTNGRTGEDMERACRFVEARKIVVGRVAPWGVCGVTSTGWVGCEVLFSEERDLLIIWIAILLPNQARVGWGRCCRNLEAWNRRLTLLLTA